MFPKGLPRRGRPSTGQAHVPAPVGGLNLRDGLPSMAANEAVILDNYFPEASFVQLRKGYAAHATGITGDVESLLTWSGATGAKMFAAVGTELYEVTVAGAVGAAAVTGLANARWQSVQFTTSGGSFLVAVNGADSARNYDGTSWTTPSITGASSSSFTSVASSQSRLWFVEADSTKAWYLPAVSIAGAATSFELGSVFRIGGKLKLIGTLSRDSGAGMDDLTVFVSSLGEIAVYQGTDPASANTWSLVGVFRGGAPIGERALIKIGGDLGVICQDGVVSVSAIMSQERSQAQKSGLTDRIRDGFSDAARLYGSLFGWQAVNYPKNHSAIFNIPRNGEVNFQYVMNTQTGAWCRFLGMDALCWGLLSEELYFGGTDGVWKADTGRTDAGTDINGHIKTAYNYLGTKTEKSITLIRPIVTANALPELAIRINTDYRDDTPTASDIFQLSSGVIDDAVWDESLWDESTWAGSDEYYPIWYDTAGEGFAISINITTATQGVAIAVNAFDLKYELQQAAAL